MENTGDFLVQPALDAKDVLPLVSVVITSFNRESFVEDAIKSALAQDYPNLEVVISDNASSDKTDEIVRRYLHDPRVKYSKNKTNIGMNANFLYATKELATGSYITFVSSDDYLVNDSFVSEGIARILEHPTVSIVHSINVLENTATGEFFTDSSYLHYKDVFYNQAYVSGKRVFDHFPQVHSISFGGSLFNREQLLLGKPFEGKVLSGDVQVILHLLLSNDVAFLNKKSYVARRHNGNATGTVTKAITYIDNFEYIEAPFRFAKQNNLLDSEYLISWKKDMYVNFSSQCILNLYKVDKREAELFSKYLQKNHLEVYHEIISKNYWRFNKIIFANKFIGNQFTKVRMFLTKLKRLCEKVYFRLKKAQ